MNLASKDSALIVVDMQNDFVRESGSLFVPSAPALVPALENLLVQARAERVRVVFTQDWHTQDDPEFAIWPVHAVAGSWGAEIISELAPEPEETCIRKLRYDAFYATSLDHLLRLWQIENLVIVGTVTNICVLHTAASAALRWYRVVVPQDGCAALNSSDQDFALSQIHSLYAGETPNLAEIQWT